MFKISVFGLSSVFYTSCTKKEPYPFIGKTHKFKNLLNLMTLRKRFLSFYYKKKIKNLIIRINTETISNINEKIGEFYHLFTTIERTLIRQRKQNKKAKMAFHAEYEMSFLLVRYSIIILFLFDYQSFFRT